MTIKLKNANDLNNWIVAAAIAEASVCEIIAAITGLSSNVFLALAIVLVVLTVVHNRMYKLNIKLWIIFVVLTLVFVFSGLLNGFESISDYFLRFSAFSVLALSIISLDIDYGKVVSNLTVIYLIRAITFFTLQRNSILALNVWAFDRVQMAYAFEFGAAGVVVVTVFIYHKLFHFSKMTMIIAAIDLIASIQVVLFDCHTRGAILIIGIAIVLMLLSKAKKSTVPIIIVIAIVGLVFMLFWEELLTFVIEFLDEFGISIPLLDKTVTLLAADNVGNGRSAIYIRALELFKSSPIIGHGIGKFESLYGAYVHDIFLEIMCEFGVIGLVVLLLFIFYVIKIIINERQNDETIFIIMIFSLTTSLITSGVYWTTFIFWYYCFLIINTSGVRKILWRKGYVFENDKRNRTWLYRSSNSINDGITRN